MRCFVQMRWENVPDESRALLPRHAEYMQRPDETLAGWVANFGRTTEFYKRAVIQAGNGGAVPSAAEAVTAWLLAFAEEADTIMETQVRHAVTME